MGKKMVTNNGQLMDKKLTRTDNHRPNLLSILVHNLSIVCLFLCLFLFVFNVE